MLSGRSLKILVWLIVLFVVVLSCINCAPNQRIEKLILDLKDSKENVRANAIDELVFIGSPAVEPLIKVLKDIDPNDEGSYIAGAGAAQALGQIRDKRAVEPLIDVVGTHLSKDSLSVAYATREEAIKALGELQDKRAVKPLIAALHDEVSTTWGEASVETNALAKIGEDAVKPLIATLKDDPWIRGQVVTALGMIGDKRAVEPLIAALNDEDALVRDQVAKALGMIGDKRVVEPLITALQNLAARENSREYQPYESPYCDDMMLYYSGNEALARIGEPAEEPLLSAFQRRDWPIIAACSYFFVLKGMADSEPVLIEALNRLGNPTIATAYLNSNNEKLADAASTWISEHGYTTKPGFGSEEDKGWGSAGQ